MTIRRGQPRATVPSWDEIMRRQQPAAGTGRDLPIGAPQGVVADGATATQRPPHDTRPTLGRVAFDRLGDQGVRADVELIHRDECVAASAQRVNPATAAAHATAQALSELLGSVVSLEVIALDASDDRVVVELTVATRQGSRRLVGAVAVDSHDQAVAAIHATLDAVNRPLHRWLATRT